MRTAITYKDSEDRLRTIIILYGAALKAASVLEIATWFVQQSIENDVIQNGGVLAWSRFFLLVVVDDVDVCMRS